MVIGECIADNPIDKTTILVQYAVYERIAAHGAVDSGIILSPFNTVAEAIEAGKRYGYHGDNYYVDILK